MAAVTTTLLVAGLVAGAASGVMSAKAQRQAGKQANADAMTEAEMTEQATLQADMEAREQIRRTRIEQRSYASGQRAASAASGVVSSTGSPLDILGRTAAIHELQIQDQARVASANYSAGFARAKQIRVGGKAAQTGAKRAATGTLISTAANTASGAYRGYDSGSLKFGTNRSLVPAS